MFINFLLIINDLSDYVNNQFYCSKLSSFMVIIIKIIKILLSATKNYLSSLELNHVYENSQDFLDYISTFHRNYVCNNKLYFMCFCATIFFWCFCALKFFCVSVQLYFFGVSVH